MVSAVNGSRAQPLDEARARPQIEAFLTNQRKLELVQKDIKGLREASKIEYVVMVGEIGGDEEERAAEYIERSMSKPVVSYIAGFTAPPGKTMGHAGAIISGSSGTAEGKKTALEAKGIRVGTTPTETAQLVADLARA